MEAVPGYRACYECPCGAYRWQKSAANKGETSCVQCGTSFASAALRFYPKRGMSSAAGQRSGGQGPRQAPQGRGPVKGQPKGGGKGQNKGRDGKGQRPWQPGRLPTPSTTGASNRLAADGDADVGAQNIINYSRAAKDQLYKVRVHYETTKGLWGEQHPFTQAAKQTFDQATREAMEKQPPGKRLASLRLELKKELSSLSHALQRCDQIEVDMARLQQEYYDMEEAASDRAQWAGALQHQVDEYEAYMQLPRPTASGARVGPRDQLQNTLQQIVRTTGCEIADQDQAEVCELIEVLLRKLNLAKDDQDQDAMEEDTLDISDPDSDGDGSARRPPRRKQRKEQPEGQGAAADATEDETWQVGLGAVGKKLARRGLLGKRTVQQLGGLAAGPGGKAGGKGPTKGKDGKGKGDGLITYSAVVQTPPPDPVATATLPAGGASAASMASTTMQPGAAFPPIGVPAGGNLTGGWPQLGAQAAIGGEPVQAAAYADQQAQLRRGEGQT